MSVTLGTTPFSNSQTLLPVLEGLGCAPAEKADTDQWYLSDSIPPEDYLLLAYNSPLQALINAMEAGQSPAKALEYWAEHAQALVTLYKGNRRRAVLINIDIAAEHLETLAEALASQWQENIELSELPETTAEHANNPYFQLLATTALQQSPHLQSLLAQLEACTLPLDETAAPAEAEQNLDALYLDLQATWQQIDQNKHLDNQLKTVHQQREQAEQNLNKTEQQLKRTEASLQEESQLLLEQLHLVQEELEKYALAAKDTEKQLQTHKTTSKTQAKQLADQTGQVAALNQQLKALKRQLQESEKNSQDAAKKNAEEAEKGLKKEQTAHIKTKAEKATLENQQKVLKTANKDQAETQASLEEENQLLLEQLHLVQEELESKFLQTKSQEQTLENLQTRLQSTETKLAQSNSQLQQSTAQQAASQKEAGLLQRRLQKLRDTLENLERTNRALNGNLAEVKNQFAAAKKHQADWEAKFQQAEREGTLALAAANRRISELNTELNMVTKSRSWRLVNPAASYNKKSKKVAAEKLEQQKTEIENSSLFDESWYQETYPDVAKAGLNSIEHYLRTGAYEGRNPSDTFDTTWYLSYYRDVTESGLNPLVHYIRFGREEERASRPGALVALPAPSAPETATQI
jgi:chromosome segregation ATPase